MTTEKKQILDVEGLRDMTIDDLQEFSNIFASEFNSSDIHDRVLCFQIIENEESKTEVESEDESKTGSDLSGPVFPTKYADLPILGVNIREGTSKDGNVCKL